MTSHADDESIATFFDSVKAGFPTSLSSDKWYLVAAASLVASSDPSSMGHLYKYLISQPEHQARTQRQALNRRLRELLMKQFPTIGAPKVAMGTIGLIKAEQPGDADSTFTKQHAVLDKANEQRGIKFLHLIFGEKVTTNMFTTWGPNFAWLTKDVVYGLFYGDDSVLDTVETELITYASIACQNMFLPMSNHLGGLQRLGLSLEEAEGVTATAEMVSKWTGQDRSSWPKVRDMVPDWKELASGRAL